MACSRLKRIFQGFKKTKLETVFFIVLFYVTMANFHIFISNRRSMKTLQRRFILYEMYRKTNPSLEVMKDVQECNYNDIIAKEAYEESLSIENAWDDNKISNLINTLDVPTENIVNGSYSPAHCNPLFSVAIIVPYKETPLHLQLFLSYMHYFLRKQKIHYKIYLVTQVDKNPFNKGVLFNIGAKIAIQDGFPCLILHSANLLPRDHSNLYACLKKPRHMSSNIDAFRYVFVYNDYAGVQAIRSDQYNSTNGYSNKFVSGGGEDDFQERLKNKELPLQRFPETMSRYTMLLHRPSDRDFSWNYKSPSDDLPAELDGLNKVDDHIEKVFINGKNLYTFIGVTLKTKEKKVPELSEKNITNRQPEIKKEYLNIILVFAMVMIAILNFILWVRCYKKCEDPVVTPWAG